MRSNGVAVAGAVGGVIRRHGGMLGGGIILALLVWRLGNGPFVEALHAVSGTALVAALLIGAVTTVLSAWRWVLVARGLGMTLSLREAVGDYYRSLFLNSVLPGGVLGDVHRAVRHGRDVGDVGLAVKGVVLERAAGQAVLIASGVTILLVGDIPGQLSRRVNLDGMALGALTLALVLAALVIVVARCRGGRAWWGRSRAAGAARSWGVHARRGLLSPGNRTGILLASAVVLVGNVAMFVVAARAAGSTVSTARLVPLLLLALMAMALPLNVGGWGPREAVTTWAFAAVGLNASQGLTMAVVFGLLALVASLPGAAILLGRRLVARAAAPVPAEVAPTTEATALVLRPSPREVTAVLVLRPSPRGVVPVPQGIVAFQVGRGRG